MNFPLVIENITQTKPERHTSRAAEGRGRWGNFLIQCLINRCRLVRVIGGCRFSRLWRNLVVSAFVWNACNRWLKSSLLSVVRCTSKAKRYVHSNVESLPQMKALTIQVLPISNSLPQWSEIGFALIFSASTVSSAVRNISDFLVHVWVKFTTIFLSFDCRINI